MLESKTLATVVKIGVWLDFPVCCSATQSEQKRNISPLTQKELVYLNFFLNFFVLFNLKLI
jgi:hypothetical protein